MAHFGQWPFFKQVIQQTELKLKVTKKIISVLYCKVCTCNGKCNLKLINDLKGQNVSGTPQENFIKTEVYKSTKFITTYMYEVS